MKKRPKTWIEENTARFMRYQFRRRLVAERYRRGWTQEFVARQIGISRSQLVNMESGVSGVTLENFRKLARLYRASADHLLGLRRGER